MTNWTAIDHPVQTPSCWEVMKYGNFKVTELYESKAEWWHGGNMYNKFDHSKPEYTQNHISVWLQDITSSWGCGNLDFEIWADEQTERKSPSVLDYHLPQHLSITASHKVTASLAYVSDSKLKTNFFFFFSPSLTWSMCQSDTVVGGVLLIAPTVPESLSQMDASSPVTVPARSIGGHISGA